MHKIKEDEHDDENAFTPDSLFRFQVCHDRTCTDVAQADEDPYMLNCKRIYSGYVRDQYEILHDIQNAIQVGSNTRSMPENPSVSTTNTSNWQRN